MKRQLLPSLSLFALLVQPGVFAAEASARPPAIGVMVGQIIDTRAGSTPSLGCQVTLNLSGDAIADAHSVYRIRVLKAVDELNRDLVKSETNASFLPLTVAPTAAPTAAQEQQRLEAVAAEVARRRGVRESQAAIIPSAPSSRPVATPQVQTTLSLPTRPTLTLRNPSRQSATIKLIEGEIELFTPTAANGGVLALDGVWDRPGELVKSDALKAAGIRLVYLTAESYDAKRRAATSTAADSMAPWSPEFAGQFQAFAKIRPSAALFFVDDPDRLLVSCEVQSPDGKRLDRGDLVTTAPQLRGVTLDAPPPAGSRLVLRIAVPAAVKSYPFKLENIPLP